MFCQWMCSELRFGSFASAIFDFDTMVLLSDYDDNTQKMGTTFTYKAKITWRYHG
tara:strand:+ start:502 stop:666 length:165 start_codon:yes stop_codon:yes gene_type:complete